MKSEVSNFQRFLNENGLTIASASRKTGVSESYLRYLASGQGDNPSVVVVKQLADGLNEDFIEIVKIFIKEI